MFAKVISAALACALLAACATPMTRLTVHSMPEGATILQDGVPVGTTPAVFTYNTRAAFHAGRCFTISPLTARWVSGASRTWQGQLCPATGQYQAYTFERPIGAPNATADNAFAAKLQLMRSRQALLQAQIDAQTQANNEAALYQAAGNLGNTLGCAAAGGCLPAPYYATPAPSQPPPSQVTCTTTKGPFDQIQTVCH